MVSHNSRSHLGWCLGALADLPSEVIVVDNGSTDGSPALVRERFPAVRLLELGENRGFGAANNKAIELAQGRYVLLLNPDAWPVGGAIEELVSFADSHPTAGVVGPRLLNPDGTLQRSVRGFPTLWRLATEYCFVRWLGPRTNLLNAFYGANFDHRTPRSAEFLVGAALLLRREALAQVGLFDESFFMFNEEVDLCYRMWRAGWSVEFFPGAEFVHVGGGSTRPVHSSMYREQLRSHLRFIAKHHGARQAEHARKLLVLAQRLRRIVFTVVGQAERARISREAADWLGSASAQSLLDPRA